MSDPRETPDEVRIRSTPREPVTDPTLGIPVDRADGPVPEHRLVTIGDSLTHGFMSAAVFRTDLAWPALVARELGLGAADFRYPTYEGPDGPGGLPLDLERLARALQETFGTSLSRFEAAPAALWARRYLDRVEDHWERGPGAQPPPDGPPLHNMAVYSWDVLDATTLTERWVEAALAAPAKDDLVKQVVGQHRARASWPVLRRAGGTVLDAAADLGRDGGIETLVVVLGSNNALGSVVSLQPAWTPEGYDDLSPEARRRARAGRNLWRPSAFAADWADLVARLRRVDARHVVVATVPSVTIAPIARGIGEKLSPRSRYFPFYVRPWVDEDSFDPDRDPHLTSGEVRAIDSAIDAYNETIVDSVAAARRDGLDWHLFDMAGLLDRLAVRRYISSPEARPPWWTPYPLPDALAGLDPVPSTRFFRADGTGRTEGGLFSLDGVHPTTVGYGILAQEVARVMQGAGVTFPGAREPLELDFAALLREDTLLSDPPAVVTSSLDLVGWLDGVLDWVTGALGADSPL